MLSGGPGPTWPPLVTGLVRPIFLSFELGIKSIKFFLLIFKESLFNLIQLKNVFGSNTSTSASLLRPILTMSLMQRAKSTGPEKLITHLVRQRGGCVTFHHCPVNDIVIGQCTC